MQLGERIRRLREKKHWSQAELAARLEIEPEELARWESGQDVPDLQQLDRLAALFSVPVKQLLRPNSGSAHTQEYPNAGRRRRLCGFGCILAIVCMILFFVEILCLGLVRTYAVQAAIAAGTAYRPELWYYAFRLPMLPIFLVTLGGAALGLWLRHKGKEK